MPQPLLDHMEGDSGVHCIQLDRHGGCKSQDKKSGQRPLNRGSIAAYTREESSPHGRGPEHQGLGEPNRRVEPGPVMPDAPN